MNVWRSIKLFFHGMRVFYGCESSWWMKLLATPVIAVLCAAVAVLNLRDEE